MIVSVTQLHIYSIKRNGLPFLSYTSLDWLASENSKKKISNKVIYGLFTFSHQLKILLACFTSEPNVYRLYRVRRVHTVCRKSFSSSALQLKTFVTAHNSKIFAKNQCLVAACTRNTVATHSVQSIHWSRYTQKQLVLQVQSVHSTLGYVTSFSAKRSIVPTNQPMRDLLWNGARQLASRRLMCSDKHLVTPGLSFITFNYQFL